MKKSGQKNSYHHGNLKESLIQTALEMVKTHGVEGITLREIGSRLGTSRSAIYRHFENKEALMKQVLLAGFDKLDEALESTFYNEELELLDRFYSMGLIYIHFARENPHLYRLLFGMSMSTQREEVCEDERPELRKLMHGDSSEETIQNNEENGFHKLVSIIIQAQTEGLFKKGDPVLFATAIWSLLHGLASLAIDGHLSVMQNIDAMYETSYKILLEGMAC